MTRGRMRRRSLVALVATLGMVGVQTQALSRPGAVKVQLTGVVAARSYAVWRLEIPVAGSGEAQVISAHDGSGHIVFVRGPAGGGGGGIGCPVLQVGITGVGAHLGLCASVSGGGIRIDRPGTYWAVALVGGGTVPLGAAIVKLKLPKGTKVKAFASGPAIALTDADFTSGGGHVVGSIAVGQASVHGSVQRTFKRALFGYFFPGPGADLHYTDPNGNTFAVDNNVMWFNAPRGTYTFRADYEEPLELRDYWGANVTGLFADIKLP